MLDETESALRNNELELAEQLLGQANDTGIDFARRARALSNASGNNESGQAYSELKRRENKLLEELSERMKAEVKIEPEAAPAEPKEARHVKRDYSEAQVERAAAIIEKAFDSADSEIIFLDEDPAVGLQKILSVLGKIDELANQRDTPARVKKIYSDECYSLVNRIHEAGHDNVAVQLWKKIGRGEPLPFTTAEEETNVGLDNLERLNHDIEQSLLAGDTAGAAELQEQFAAEVASMPFSLNRLATNEKISAQERLDDIQAANRALYGGAGEPTFVEPSTETKLTKKQAAIFERAKSEGINLYPEMATKWNEFTLPRERGGTLWSLVDRQLLTPKEALDIIDEIKSVKEWRTKKVNLSELTDAFQILLKKKQVKAIKSAVEEMRSMNAAMDAAYNEAKKKGNKK